MKLLQSLLELSFSGRPLGSHRWGLRGALLGALMVAAPACNGVLTVSEPLLACERDADCSTGSCAGGVCITVAQACSPTALDGFCPDDLNCVAGVCLNPGGSGTPGSGGSGGTWCDCGPNEACESGTCAPVSDDPCGISNPSGLCANGELCTGGFCTPCNDQNACAPNRKNGCCPQASACDDGFCRPLNELGACSPAEPNGFCGPGQACLSGVCENEPCAPSFPAGFCTKRDFACQDGRCQALPCSATRTGGVCTGDFQCSGLGNCLPPGQCDVTQDCTPGTFCSVSGVCIQNGTCNLSEDCSQYFTCDTAANACVRERDCTSDTQCPPTEFCSNTLPRQCLLKGRCEGAADCNPDQDCATEGLCIPAGTCLSADDCAQGERCSVSGTCLGPYGCVTNDDCRPGRVCAPNNLCVIDATNTCDANTVDGICRAGGACCNPGQRCATSPTDCPAACAGANPPATCPPDCGQACILDGQCLTDADCLSVGGTQYFTCENFACVPQQLCFSDSDCTANATDRCNVVGACIPSGRCARDNDCIENIDVCDANYRCVTGGCAVDEADADLVEPNMLVLLDRSGSMDEPVGNTCEEPAGSPFASLEPETGLVNTRWNYARAALAEVLLANDERIRFGLSTFPLYCTDSLSTRCAINTCENTNSCYGSCAWNNECAKLTTQAACDERFPCAWNNDTASCAPLLRFSNDSSGGNRIPGTVDVAVGGRRARDVIQSLRPPDAGNNGRQHPGGGTPTAPSLREILQARAQFGLISSISEPRPNYILLVTDGDANNSQVGNSSYADGCSTASDIRRYYPVNDSNNRRTNCALDKLATASDPVRTFVIGFIGGTKGSLNCNAYWGRTSTCTTDLDCKAIPDQATCQEKRDCNWSVDKCDGGILTALNCDSVADVCYYEATDSQKLLEKLNEIVDSVATCSFTLSKTPSGPEQLVVRLRNNAQGTEETLTQNPGDPAGYWTYDSTRTVVEISGPACERIQAGLVTPRVIFGCSSGGG